MESKYGILPDGQRVNLISTGVYKSHHRKKKNIGERKEKKKEEERERKEGGQEGRKKRGRVLRGREEQRNKGMRKEKNQSQLNSHVCTFLPNNKKGIVCV